MKKTISFMLLLALCMAGLADAEFVLGEPMNLGSTINGPDNVLGVCISPDGLDLYFCSDRSGGYGDYDLWVANRPTSDDEWGTPVNLGPTVNSQYGCMAPSLSADGLALYFSDYDYSPQLPGGFGDTDIWVVTRPKKDAAWSDPMNLGQPVNWHGGDVSPSISTDDLSIYFATASQRGAPDVLHWYDLWLAKRPTTDSPWGQPVSLSLSVNSELIDVCPSISSDGLALFFCSDRTEGYGDFDLWMTSRVTKESEWRSSVNLGSIVNSSTREGFPSISADGSTLYFCSARPGGFGGYYGDIYQAPIIPIVDLNTDGVVDAADMVIMVDNWGTDDSLCDIGPMPWGDGIVDVQDLIVLAEHLFEEVPPAEPVE